MICLIWTITILTVIFLYLRQALSRFSDHGVNTLKPIPILGNMMPIFTKRMHFVETLQELYQSFPEDKFVGRFELMNPVVVVRDLELTKKIVIKDFDHFLDHRVFASETAEPILARNLFSLKGQEWKDMRSTLTPAFTGSKIKLMAPFMDEVGQQMVKVLKKKIQDSGDDRDIDIKDLTSRFANDVIATCAFGLNVDSYTEEDNIFYKMGRATTSFKFKDMLIFFINVSCPAVLKFLNLTILSEATKNFFSSLVLNTISEREAKNITRSDMIHMLMQAKKGNLIHEHRDKDSKEMEFAATSELVMEPQKLFREWSNGDLVAQAVLFFIAGFETMSAAMSFGLHELATHPEIQQRLAEEVREYYEKNNYKFDYNSIQSMPYLDIVVSEILRLWPAGLILERVCVKDYNMGRPNDKATQDYIIRKGDSLIIPTWAIHRDPRYFPDPMKFDPERFSIENRHKINSIAYMPFGLGPRNCIGSRFALCELKIMLYRLLLNFHISPCEKTQIPPRLASDAFHIKIAGGHWANFRLREQSVVHN